MLRPPGEVSTATSPGTQSEETPAAGALVAAAVGSGVLTARGGDRVRRVARTIADLAGLDQVGEDHTAEAIGLRGDWRDD